MVSELGRSAHGEIWQDLIGHRAIQQNRRLRELLLNEQSFEIALGLVQAAPYEVSDRQTFERALLDTFVAMDREVSRIPDPWINSYKVQELLFRICGRRSNVGAGYMFTLNQDLWPERYLYDEHPHFSLPPDLPGLRRNANQPIFTSVIGNYSENFIMRPIEEPSLRGELRDRFNVIKLHGSFNWRTADARTHFVMGTNKDKQIQESSLLSWYFEIFKKVLSVGGVRLMIAGYGFGDEHVNEIIANAFDQHNLVLFIWDTGPDLKTRLLLHRTALPFGADC